MDDELTAMLRKKFGRDPSPADVAWAKLNAQLLNDARAGQMGDYTNTRLTMAQQLEKEHKPLDALYAYLDVIILGMNGASNAQMGSPRATPAQLGSAMFDPEFAELLPYMVGKIDRCVAASKIAEADLHTAFATAWQRLPGRAFFQTTEEEGWTQLRGAIKVG